MIRHTSFLENQQHLVVIVWLLAIAFFFGVAVGFSGKSLFGDSPQTQSHGCTQGRFGHVVKTF